MSAHVTANRRIRNCSAAGALVTLVLVAVLTPGVYPLLLEKSAAFAVPPNPTSPSTKSLGNLQMTLSAHVDDQHRAAEAVVAGEVPPEQKVDQQRLADVSLPSPTQPAAVRHFNATKLALPPAVFTTGSVVHIRQDQLESKRVDCFVARADGQPARSSQDYRSPTGEAIGDMNITDELAADARQHQGRVCDPERRIPIPVARPMLPPPRAGIARTLTTGKGPTTKRAVANGVGVDIGNQRGTEAGGGTSEKRKVSGW
jgi:hypothetical protein